MTLPYSFMPGELARSAHVMANFNYLLDRIGSGSKPGSLDPTGSVILGPRKTVELTAEQDSGNAAMSYFQISWNASWSGSGTTYKFKRIINNTGATALRVGVRGIELLSTISKTGDVNTQMKSNWRVGEDQNGKMMYIPADMKLSLVNESPDRISERRLTTVLLDTAVPIYKMAKVGKGTSILSAYSYGIPRTAAAIIVNAHVTAGPDSGAGMFFFKQEGPNIDRSNNFNGMVAHATITGTGWGMRTGNQGIVPLGTGSYAGKFFVHRTAYFEQASVWIIGYLV